MFITLLKAKLHRATVTRADLNYEGSISIDKDLLEASGILPNEQVDVLDITNGARFTTYAIEAPAGSRMIGINGAAARLVHTGDLVIVIAYATMTPDEAKTHKPVVVLMEEGNEIKKA
jgi:aspartate 1-decarboxylase